MQIKVFKSFDHKIVVMPRVLNEIGYLITLLKKMYKHRIGNRDLKDLLKDTDVLIIPLNKNGANAFNSKNNSLSMDSSLSR